MGSREQFEEIGKDNLTAAFALLRPVRFTKLILDVRLEDLTRYANAQRLRVGPYDTARVLKDEGSDFFLVALPHGVVEAKMPLEWPEAAEIEYGLDNLFDVEAPSATDCSRAG